MKKEYISLEIELFILNDTDIITASSDDVIGDDIFDD